MMTKQTMYSPIVLDLVFSSRPARAAGASSLAQRAYNALKIKKRSILGKNIQKRSGPG